MNVAGLEHRTAWAAWIDEPPRGRRTEWRAAGSGHPDGLALDGLRILLVEDEAMIAMDLESVLEDAGAEIAGLAASVSQALALIERRLPDAALLDVNLHGRDVYPVADALQARGVPFLFHTGHATRQSLNARYPDAPVLIKPAEAGALVATIRLIARG